MRNKTLVAILVAALALLTLVSVAAAKKPPSPGNPHIWRPTHYAVFTGHLININYGLLDQQVQDTRTIISSNWRVNDFELDFPEDGLEGCPTPSQGVQGFLSIRKPSKKNILEIRHNWNEEGYYFTLLCADGSFEEDGDRYDISHNGDCTVSERYAGEEGFVHVCTGVIFNIAIDPISP
jgi:hypothetical protein